MLCIQSVVSTATLVINLLLGPILHGTPLAVGDIVYTLVIVAGVVLCILGGSAEEMDYTAEDLFALPSVPSFQVCLCMCVGYLCVCVCLSSGRVA